MIRIKVLLTILIFSSVFVIAQNKNKLDSKTSEQILIGEINRQAFNDSLYSWWFNSEYQMYEVDSTSLKEVAKKLNNLNITLVMGTWCSDSRREVPRLFRILDYLKYPINKMKMFAVDRNMKGNKVSIDSLGIKRVPTIILYDKKKEIGRIIESPKYSLEKDLIMLIGWVYKK